MTIVEKFIGNTLKERTGGLQREVNAAMDEAGIIHPAVRALIERFNQDVPAFVGIHEPPDVNGVIDIPEFPPDAEQMEDQDQQIYDWVVYDEEPEGL